MKLPLKEKVVHELFQGKGDIAICDIATSNMMRSRNRCFIIIRLKQGDSLGVHRHEQECEIYYVMQGRGWYRDNEQEYEIQAGEAVICQDGDSHGISNNEKEELVFIALVVSFKEVLE